MYKITYEKTVGEVSKKTTIETDDVDLVKAILEMDEDISVHSDADNLNIDPEWQELLQWFRNKKEAEDKEKREWQEAVERMRNAPKKAVEPYVSPFIQPYDPNLPWGNPGSPFTVIC